MSDIEAIRKRLESATPGPWQADLDVFDHESAEIEATVNNWPVSMLFTAGCGVSSTGAYEERIAFWAKAKASQMMKDAEFIAAAPTDIAALLAEIDRLTTALTTAKDEERAAVVAFLRAFDMGDPVPGFAEWFASPDPQTQIGAAADVIEAGRHREKA